MDKNFTRIYRKLSRRLHYIFETAKTINSNSKTAKKSLRGYFKTRIDNQKTWLAARDFARKINASSNLPSLYETIAKEFKTFAGAEFCALCIYKKDSKKFVLHSYEENEKNNYLVFFKEFLKKAEIFLSHKDQNFLEFNDFIKNNLKAPFFLVPLQNKGELTGGIFWVNSKKGLSENRNCVLGFLAELAAYAIKNAEICTNLKRQDNNKLEFIASVSHDLKNRLHTLIGYSDLLNESDFEDQEQVRKYAQRISTCSTHMSHLLIDILERARAEANKIRLNYETFSPKVVILEVLSTHESALSSKNIELVTSFDDTLICADAQRFKRVIYNLISNAAKFTNNNGRIEITTLCKNNDFYFEIKDNGEGISKEKQDKLFDFFTKASDESAGEHAGYGLGLAICKRVIELHKGEIKFVSKKDEGSTFFFRIPVQNPALEKALC